MKQNRVLIYCALMCIITGLTVYWLQQNQNKKIAVVDAVRLFDEYHMKKEMEKKAKGKLQMLSSQLDSLENKLRMANATKDTTGLGKLSNSYRYLKATLENEYSQSNHDINTEVWKRLNPLVDEYGKKMHMHLIIGANGMGSVLYNDDYYDLTNEVIKFVNKKYEEGN